jgi:hypothetical protein
MAQQLIKCGFDVFDVGTLVMEELNIGIERANVSIDILDVCLSLEVVSNQFIEFLGAGGGHLEKW